MSTPDGFDFDPERYHFDAREISDDGWVRFVDGGLSQPVDVKLKHIGGRMRVVGIRYDNGEFVSSSTLREPRLEEIERLFGLFVRELAADAATGTQKAANAAEAASVDQRGWAEMNLDSALAHEQELQTWLNGITAPPDLGAVTARGRGAAPPSEDEYRAFSLIYLDQVEKNPRRAVSETAKAIGIDRSTVYRWIDACRAPERQFLPARDED